MAAKILRINRTYRLRCLAGLLAVLSSIGPSNQCVAQPSSGPPAILTPGAAPPAALPETEEAFRARRPPSAYDFDSAAEAKRHLDAVRQQLNDGQQLPSQSTNPFGGATEPAPRITKIQRPAVGDDDKRLTSTTPVRLAAADVEAPIAPPQHGDAKPSLTTANYSEDADVPSIDITLPTKIILVLVHVLVIASIFAIIFACVRAVWIEPDHFEKTLLIASIAAGFLAYSANHALGISIPNLMSQALGTASPFGIASWGVIFPSVSGIVVAWFILKMAKKDQDIAKRAALLMCMFIVTMFADVYAVMGKKIGTAHGKYALPNITFVLGIVFYVIFTYRRPQGEARYGR